MASEDTGTPHVNGIETIEVSQSDPRDPPPFTSGVGRRKLVKLLFPVKFKPDSSLPLPGRKVVLLSNSATAIPVIPSPHPLPTPPTATPPTPTTSSAVETTNGAQISKSASSAKPNEIDGVVKRKKAVDVAAMQPAGKRDLRSRPMGGDKKKTSCASEESQRGLATVRPPTVTNGRLPVSPREKGSHRGVSPELNAKQGQQTLGILDQSPHSLQPSNPSSDPPPEPITVGPVIDPALLPPLFSAATDLVLRDLARHFPADLRNRWLSGVVHEFVGEYYGRVPQNSGLGLSSIPPLSGAWQHARNPSTPAVQPTSSVVPLSLPPPRREVRRRVSWAMPKLVANSGQQLREKAESKPDPETESLDDKTLELSLTPLTEETSVLPQNGTETDDNTLVRAPSDDIPANLEPHQSPDSRMSDRSQSRERLNPPRTPPRTSPSRGADDNPTGAAALVLSTKQPGKLPSFKKSRTLAGKHQFVEASPSKTHRSMIANGRGPNLNSPANQGDDSVSDSDSENGEGSNLRKTKKPTRMKVKRGRQPIGREDSEESEDARPPRKLQKSQSHGQDVEDDDDDLAEFFGAGVRERRTVMDSDSDEEKMHIDETDPPVSEDRSVEDVQLEVRAKDEMELDQTSSLEESLPTPTVDSTKLGYISSSPSLLSAPQLPLVPLPVTTFPVPTPTPVSAPGFTSRSSKGRPSKPLPPPKVVRVTPARTRDSTAFAAFRESVESAFDNSDCEDSAVERTLEGVRRRRAVARRRSGMELIRGEVMGGWRDELARIAGPRDEHIALSKVASLDDIISPESLQGRDEEDRRFLELAFVDERKKWNHQLEGAGRYASEERWRREVELNGRDLEARNRNRTPSPHKTGSARTEGYYPLTPSQKPHLRDRSTTLLPDSSSAPKNPKNPVAHVPKISSRAIRSSQRNLVAGLEQAAGDAGEVAGLGQFKERAKKLRFGRSRIHNWGLFAQEPVDAGDIVVEYIGQLIRQRVADQREHQYLSSGIGSSYLFRVDEDTIIDATKMGNLARFINHSCDPNCNAKIINLDGQKKIVIYAKKDIEEGDEITYDYKFPLEAEKLPCYCGSKNCRGSLN